MENELIEQINNVISESIHEKWNIATLYVERQDRYVGAYCKYINDKQEELIMDDSLLGYSFSLLIHQLHKLTTQNDKNKWNRLQIEFQSNNKYEANYIFDQEYQDKIDALNK